MSFIDKRFKDVTPTNSDEEEFTAELRKKRNTVHQQMLNSISVPGELKKKGTTSIASFVSTIELDICFEFMALN